MRIVTVVGARPQFIKAAMISREIRSQHSGSVEEYLIHTGQHYDPSMSEVFFDQLEIPEPEINLDIGSGTHGAMTGRMLESIEKILIRERPHTVLVYGDTNSTLAGALAASKLHIPVAHVEAGLRSFNMLMPEEQNRVLTDHVSRLLFCPTDTAVNNLLAEGITDGVHRTGDIMLDANVYYRDLPHELSIDVPADFFLITLHRAENTDDPDRLYSIVNALNAYEDLPAVLPMHPRTKKKLAQYGLEFGKNIRTIEPVGYLDMLQLESDCRFVVTDSGGVQKEAYFFQKPCITLRDETEWVETERVGANVLVGADRESIGAALRTPPAPREWVNLFGDGHSAGRIVKTLVETV